MNIELVTTKKKVTKSIINQLRRISTDIVINDLDNIDVIGYVVGCRKNSYKCIILKFKNEYFYIDASWKKGTKNMYRKVGKWSYRMEIDNEELVNKFYHNYKIICSSAKQFFI